MIVYEVTRIINTNNEPIFIFAMFFQSTILNLKNNPNLSWLKDVKKSRSYYRKDDNKIKVDFSLKRDGFNDTIFRFYALNLNNF